MPTPKISRTTDVDYSVEHIIAAPAHTTFAAWTNADQFKQWWIPEGAPMTLKSCEVDARKGGGYRLVFLFDSIEMAFFGKYLDVVPNEKLVWTNDEGGADASVTTTVTFKEKNGQTTLQVHDRYPSKELLDQAIADGSTSGLPVQLEQLNQFVSRSSRT